MVLTNLCMFLWEAMQDVILMILAVCAVIALVVKNSKEGWPKGADPPNLNLL
jgi:P-type Ca2+ transporter type 2C